MGSQGQALRADRLLFLLLAYGAASLFHYAHNAVFLDAYPNMPAWLSLARVYAAWLCVTGIGLFGYLLVRRGYRLAGLVVIAVYGALGLDGLGHYGLAPRSAHTFTMNLTIWLEAVTAVLLLVTVAGLVVRQLRRAHA
jgi:hypothetical protein